MRRLVLSCFVALAPGCYLDHERSEIGGLADAATDAAPRSDASECTLGMPATVTFSPPIAMPATDIRVVLLGIDADPTVNGLRIHLDVCGGMPPCVVDMIVSQVGDALAAVHVPPSSASGTLTSVASGSAFLHLVDERECAICGGELAVLAGPLVSGLDPDLSVQPDRVVCSQGCGDDRAIALAGHGTGLVVSQGIPVDAPPLHARVASNFVTSCVRCDCALPDVPATGLVAAYDGWFEHGP